MSYLDKTGLSRLWLHITDALSTKVSKEEGKALSSNDYTTEDKEQLASVVSLVGDTSVAEQINTAIANKSDVGHVHDDRYYTEEEIDEILKFVRENAGTSIVINDAADHQFLEMSLFGKTVQEGTPTVEAPIEMISAGEDGNISVSVSNETEVVSSATFNTPNGLLGIPVSTGGNYTDANGQRWISDEIDLDRGVYIQRCKKQVFDGSQGTLDYYSGYCRIKWSGQTTSSRGLCDKFIYTTVYSNRGIGNNGTFFSIPGSMINCTTAAEWRTWIEANPITVIYALATPIETALTTEELNAYKALKTIPDYTLVANDEDVYMTLEYATLRTDEIEKVVHAGVLPIKSGGTGAITPIAARENLLIIVSETAPENPVEGMLWFDIS